MFDKLLRELRKPTGIEVEWYSGGFNFSPPLWTWLVLLAALWSWVLWRVL